jgi:hypothetical protein
MRPDLNEPEKSLDKSLKGPDSSKHRRSASEDTESKGKRFWKRKNKDDPQSESRVSMFRRNRSVSTADAVNVDRCGLNRTSVAVAGSNNLTPEQSSVQISKSTLSSKLTQASLESSDIPRADVPEAHVETPLDPSTPDLNADPIEFNLESKNWTDLVPQAQLDLMLPEDIKRQRALWELYQTEAAYVKDLRMVMDV